jgi:polyisoprenoid-binding protein YceI
MSRILAVFAVLLGSLAPALAQDVSTDPAKAPTGTYALETRHSQVLFSIAHLGLTDFWGRIDGLSGTLNFDNSALEKSSVTIAIDMTTVDTPSQRLNSELEGPNVFNASADPTATFQSTSVERTGANSGKIIGNLTLHGVTRPVTLDVTFNGGRSSPMGDGYDLGFSATTTVKRTDFGLTGMPWEPMVGNDVKLTIEALFEKKS